MFYLKKEQNTDDPIGLSHLVEFSGVMLFLFHGCTRLRAVSKTQLSYKSLTQKYTLIYFNLLLTTSEIRFLGKLLKQVQSQTRILSMSLLHSILLLKNKINK